MRREQVPGIALVVIGATLLLLLQIGAPGEVVVALVGAALLVVYAATRVYGFLVPGGIVTGLGVGLVVEPVLGRPGAPLLGLAGGFALVALIDRLSAGRRPGGWWPLVPGGVLAAIGLAQAIGDVAWLARWWPVALIAWGVVLLVRRLRAARGDDDSASPPPS